MNEVNIGPLLFTVGGMLWSCATYIHKEQESMVKVIEWVRLSFVSTQNKGGVRFISNWQEHSDKNERKPMCSGFFTLRVHKLAAALPHKRSPLFLICLIYACT